MSSARFGEVRTSPTPIPPARIDGRFSKTAVTLVSQIVFLTVAAALPLFSASVSSPHVRPIRWTDLPAAIQRRVQAGGADSGSFESFRQDHERRTKARVAEGDLDALVYYALQSTAFTKAPPIEPALSARAFVDSLDAESRRRFLAGELAGADRVPKPVQPRFQDRTR